MNDHQTCNTIKFKRLVVRLLDGMSQIQGALAATTPHELSNTPIKSNNFTQERESHTPILKNPPGWDLGGGGRRREAMGGSKGKVWSETASTVLSVKC